MTILTDIELKEKILLVLKEFLRENYGTNLKKKKIFLKDTQSCIPKMQYDGEKIEVFDKFNNYICFFHQNPFLQYVIIKKDVKGKNLNVLTIMEREHIVFDGMRLSAPIPIDPKKLIENYCYAKLNRETYLPEDINILRHYIWNSIDFILNNIDRYHHRQNLEDRHLLEMIFQEIVNKEEESIFFLRNMLLNQDLMIEIY